MALEYADAYFNPDWGYALAPQFKTIVTELESGGLPQGSDKWQHPRWLIQFRSIHNTRESANATASFFGRHRGRRKSFLWTVLDPLDEMTPIIECVFTADSIPRTRNRRNRWEFDFQLVGVNYTPAPP